MTSFKLAEDGLALLAQVLNEGYQRASQNDLRAAFICRHTRNIFHLGDDVLALQLQGRTSAAPIVVRPMIENLFRFVAALNNPSFAAEKLVAEPKDAVRRCQDKPLQGRWHRSGAYESTCSKMRVTTFRASKYSSTRVRASLHCFS
jgi:hypothetical protein